MVGLAQPCDEALLSCKGVVVERGTQGTCHWFTGYASNGCAARLQDMKRKAEFSEQRANGRCGNARRFGKSPPGEQFLLPGDVHCDVRGDVLLLTHYIRHVLRGRLASIEFRGKTVTDPN
jgi:hypothetical protein